MGIGQEYDFFVQETHSNLINFSITVIEKEQQWKDVYTVVIEMKCLITKCQSKWQCKASLEGREKMLGG